MKIFFSLYRQTDNINSVLARNVRIYDGLYVEISMFIKTIKTSFLFICTFKYKMPYY